MKKIIRSLSVKYQYTIEALRRINMPHIGDLVDYNGEQCTLIQGVQKPLWDLLPMDKVNLDRPKRKIYNCVHESKFKMKPLYKRFGFSFMSTYKFYKDYWYSIDMAKRGRISFIQSYETKTMNPQKKHRIAEAIIFALTLLIMMVLMYKELFIK